MTRHIRETMAWLRAQGVEPELVRVKHHAVLDCRRPDGTTVRLVCPATPSDYRGTANFRAYCKRRLGQ